MTDRREFLGAVAAVFCGILLPVPLLESIVVPSRHNNFLLIMDEATGISAKVFESVYKSLTFGSQGRLPDFRAF